MPRSPEPAPERPLDLAGIGIGPAGLSLAALADPLPELTAAWFEQRPAFHWHPGLLIPGTTLQVPYLADLVTLADPTSRWSYLNYLKEHQRLYPFYFAERLHIPRTDYDAYCRWVSRHLPALHFGHQVTAVHWNATGRHFDLDLLRTGVCGAAATTRRAARNLVLCTGSAPHVPEPLRPLTGTGSARPTALHSADYLTHRDHLLAAGHVTVIGSGQSGAEVFLDLLRHRPAGRERLSWLTRSPAFAPMEYSKLGLEHFTPDYTRYFHGLDETTRDRLLARQGQLHKAIDHQTLADIHDELAARAQHGDWPDAVLTPGVTVHAATRTAAGAIELDLEHHEQRATARLTTDAVVLATGYRDRPLDPLLASLGTAVGRDSAGRPDVDEHHRLRLDPAITGTVYVAGAERHTHGVGTPDLGLIAHRSAGILNTLLGTARYPLPERTAFTTFGLNGPRTPAERRSSEQASAHR